MKNLLIFLYILYTISCASTQRPIVYNVPQMTHEEVEQQNKEIVTENVVEEVPENIDIEITEFIVEEEIITEDEKQEEHPADTVYSNTVTYTISPTSNNFSGGAVVYNYIPNHIYQLFTAPFKIVDIALEPGEKLVNDPACGDTVNFLLGTSFSYTNNIKQEHIHIKAIYAGKSTTLTINTNKRVYRFNVISYNNTFMPIVSFNYPLDTINKMNKTTEQHLTSVIMSGNITDFDFGYEIIPHSTHRLAWIPSIIFNDGVKTYIYFSSAKRASYAPVLLSVEGKERVLINYRVVGDYYIVDSVLEHAELILDINNGNLITIKRVD